ncbi:MAG: DegV family protein [Chitinophagales bacterium]
MQELAIVTDSVADLPKDLCQTYDVTVIPLTVTVGGQSYRDRVDLSVDEFYRLMREEEWAPQTSQPSPGVFLEVYRRLVQAGRKVISLHLSGFLSGTVRTAQLARDQLVVEERLPEDAVTVVDTLNGSMGQGWQVLAAAEAAAAGQSLPEALRLIGQVRERVRLFLHVPSLEYLHKGGRITTVTALVGSLLHITPLLGVVNGVVQPIAKLRGEGQVLRKYLELVGEGWRAAQAAGEHFRLAVMHADAAAAAERLRAHLTQELKLSEQPLLVETGPVIGRHVGPGALGVAFY